MFNDVERSQLYRAAATWPVHSVISGQSDVHEFPWVLRAASLERMAQATTRAQDLVWIRFL